MIVAKTRSLVYEAGGIYVETRVKGREVDIDTTFLRGRRIVGGGCGTYVTATPSHLTLTVLVDDKEFEVWIERDVRRMLGLRRLSAKRRSVLEETMPSEVAVEERRGRRGTLYYRIHDESLAKWIAACRSPEKER